VVIYSYALKQKKPWVDHFSIQTWTALKNVIILLKLQLMLIWKKF